MSSAKGASATRGRQYLGDNLKFGLRCGASALALSLVFGASALAQTATATTEDTVDEVVVTSIRQSLKSSQQLKQSSEIIGDSITAEDIGALPDRSVTEALQRVPGVSINRFAAGVDPDHFSTEGSGVVVRGLNFVRSELNGRDTFSANNGRALSFADVPSELMGGVDVFKSPSADMIEGGISGTVNLRTRLPFDSSKRILSLSVESSYGDLVEKWAPTYTFLYSDRFDTPIGEIGVLGSYVKSKLWTRSDGTQASNFSCRTDLGTGGTCPSGAKGVWFPRGAAFRSTDTERDREGIAGAVQWKSNDGTMQASLQYLRSESKQKWTEHAVEIATDNVTSNGDSRPVTGTTFTFDEDGIFTDGIITGNTGWRADQNSGQARTPINGLQSNNIRRDVDQTYLTSDYGFNFRWTPNDHWGVQFDYQHVDSNVDVIDVGLWASTFQNLQMTLRGDDAPIINFLPPSANGTVATCATPTASCPSYMNAPHDTLSDPYNSYWRSVMDHIEQSEGQEDAAKVDVEYKFLDHSWLDSVKGGVRWSKRDQTTRFSAYNWGVVSEIWGEGGPVWFTDKIDGVPNAGGLPGTTGTDSTGLVEAWAFENFFRGKVPVPTGAQPRLFYANNIVSDYNAFSQFALSIGDEWRSRISSTTGCPQNWVPLALRCDVTAGTPFRPGEVNPVTEETKSAYGMVRFAHDFGDGMKLTGNLGLRYTTVDRASEALMVFQRTALTTPAQCSTATTLSEFCKLPQAQREAAQAFLNGAALPNNAQDSYDYWLPSFNAKLSLPNKVQLRFGASKTINPPDLGYVRNHYNITLDVSDATLRVDPTLRGIIAVGNPYLRPTESFNLDFSAEWYFAPVGSLTLALFNKEIDNVLTNSTETIRYTNNGQSFDVKVSKPMNSDKTAKVRGFEIGYQQFYDFLPKPLDGFGINANYSYIHSKGVPQTALSNTDPDVGAGRISNVDTSLLPLQGLSKHNVNFAAIYEKGPISARLAYNWRSDFLLTVRDVIVPYAPIMNEATGQLDGSLFLTVNPKVKIGVQGVNLLNEVTRTSQVLNNDLLKTGRSWFMNDRRYTFVLRASF